MFCPSCGYDAGEAKHCPDCGADLTVLRAARGSGKAPQAPAPRRSPSAQTLLIAGAIVVIAAVVAVALVSHHSTNGNGTSASASAPANPDLSGTYSQLVTRANVYYKKGEPYASSGDYTSAAPWFAAAAKVLQAAWNKQPGDPNVGADLANALFYSGNIQGAIKQIDKVLKISPKDQSALLDKADFVNMAGQMDKESSGPTKASAEIAEAKRLYKAAIAVDPKSNAGKTAAAELKKLDQSS